MATTSIEWTDRAWNPVRGCSRVSAGCDNCYAMNMAHRFSGAGKPFEGLTTIRRGKVDWAGVARFIPGQLGAPLHWRKPTRIFVNSMSDLFHPSLSNEEIAAVFGVMAACPQHTFQVLTKQPKRAAAWFEWLSRRETALITAAELCGLDAQNEVFTAGLNIRPLQPLLHAATWPLPNVWLGVSAENQKTADERIPVLLELPAAVRFVSAEPLLDLVDFSFGLKGSSSHHFSVDVAGALRNRSFDGMLDGESGRELSRAEAKAQLEKLRAQGVRVLPMTSECDGFSDQTGCPGHRIASLDWVIVGGESGPGARPFSSGWARAIVDQCRDAGVPCFVKQLGGNHFAPWKVEWREQPNGDIEAVSLDRSGRKAELATVWPNGVWHTWDANGTGGENASEPTVELAKAAVIESLQRQHLTPIKGWAQHAHMLRDKKGGNMSEWPLELRVREFPGVR